MALHWLYFRPSLFQHVGTHSSLKGKVQKLRDKGFGKLTLYVAHKNNPPAEATSSLMHYKTYSIGHAYDGDNFYWAMSPSAGDSITFNFTTPVELSRYFFRSGSVEHPEDRFPVNSTVEVLPEDPMVIDTFESARNGSALSNGWNLRALQKTPDGFYLIGLFQPNGIAHGPVPAGLGLIKTLRIKISSDSTHWAILSEVSFSVELTFFACANIIYHLSRSWSKKRYNASNYKTDYETEERRRKKSSKIALNSNLIKWLYSTFSQFLVNILHLFTICSH